MIRVPLVFHEILEANVDCEVELRFNNRVMNDWSLKLERGPVPRRAIVSPDPDGVGYSLSLAFGGRMPDGFMFDKFGEAFDAGLDFLRRSDEDRVDKKQGR